MGGTYCCVPLCKNNRRHSREVSFHSFPKDVRLRKAWTRRVRRQRPDGKFSTWTPSQSDRICGAHFNESGKKKYEDHLPCLFPNKIYKTKFLNIKEGTARTRTVTDGTHNLVFYIVQFNEASPPLWSEPNTDITGVPLNMTDFGIGANVTVEHEGTTVTERPTESSAVNGSSSTSQSQDTNFEPECQMERQVCREEPGIDHSYSVITTYPETEVRDVAEFKKERVTELSLIQEPDSHVESWHECDPLDIKLEPVDESMYEQVRVKVEPGSDPSDFAYKLESENETEIDPLDVPCKLEPEYELEFEQVTVQGEPVSDPSDISYKFESESEFLCDPLKVKVDPCPPPCDVSSSSVTDPATENSTPFLQPNAVDEGEEDLTTDATFAGRLISHRKSHVDEKLFKCVNCEKEYKCNSYLKRHMRTHSGEHPFVCTVCGKRFKYNRSFKIHMKIHNRDLFFQCTVCNDRFTSALYLMKHNIRMHTAEERPFQATVESKQDRDQRWEGIRCYGIKRTI